MSMLPTRFVVLAYLGLSRYNREINLTLPERFSPEKLHICINRTLRYYVHNMLGLSNRQSSVPSVPKQQILSKLYIYVGTYIGIPTSRKLSQ